MMKKSFKIWCLLLVLSWEAVAQTPGIYAELFSEKDLRSTIKFLSDDGFEGRAPGSRGGELAAKYLASQLELAGINPGNKGSYFQPVSLVGLRPDPNTVLSVSGNSDGKAFRFTFGKDFVGYTGAQKDDVSVEGDLVFVGYGISAPELNWNDYKGEPALYKDKILLMFVNDPPATAAEPDLFGGKALTYYGRWTYKYEEAARRGAKGVILIHTDESAGYGWNVVETSFGGTERFEIARSPDDKSTFLQLKSWIKASSVADFVGAASLASMTKAAQTRDFQPFELNAKISVNLKAALKKVDSNNVVGIWDGSDPKFKNEYVVYTAHWDHLGVGKPNAAGDTIYNGALDNASGCAQLLALARAITKLTPRERPKRSQVFVFTTAEEQGLLGAEWYARFPLFPLNKTAAEINVDGGNFYGKTRNFGALGAERSSLGRFVDEELAKRGMKFMADNRPEQGSFFRSDHFPLAKMGVPALSIRNGDDYVGKEAGWADKAFAEFNKNYYHQPSDEFRDDWQYDGMVQMLDIVLAIGMRASNADQLPAFNPKDEFAKAQPARK